ncbi:MAG: hypothetical protein VZR73_18105 [Acutalibacteraceae bacterium]|nr:hypothetical protein [Acutalibacteraceae bacterium]
MWDGDSRYQGYDIGRLAEKQRQVLPEVWKSGEMVIADSFRMEDL